ncbi:MAG: hypothetical protein SO063_07645 [Eubacteriales bacterium]|nr:hypothetical protein [Eubacteriales bacterium]
MSSLMIHLCMAHALRPDAPAEYYVGHIAPDCVDIREIKDHTHFRDRTDRMAALEELRAATRPEDDYGEGILAHLYLDCMWDALVLDSFRQLGVAAYRREISRAGAYLYRREPWADALWEKIDACPPEKYASRPDFPPEKIRELIVWQRGWYAHADGAPSEAYPPDFCVRFLDKTAREYQKWREKGE